MVVVNHCTDQRWFEKWFAPPADDGTADNFLFLAIVGGTIVVLKSSSPVEIEFIAEKEVLEGPCKLLDA